MTKCFIKASQWKSRRGERGQLGEEVLMQQWVGAKQRLLVAAFSWVLGSLPCTGHTESRVLHLDRWYFLLQQSQYLKHLLERKAETHGKSHFPFVFWVTCCSAVLPVSVKIKISPYSSSLTSDFSDVRGKNPNLKKLDLIWGEKKKYNSKMEELFVVSTKSGIIYMMVWTVWVHSFVHNNWIWKILNSLSVCWQNHNFHKRAKRYYCHFNEEDIKEETFPACRFRRFFYS